MSWATMPSDIVVNYINRCVVEAKAFRAIYKTTIPANTAIWLLVTFSSTKDILLYDRLLGASTGPIEYDVFGDVEVVGSLGTSIDIFNANRKYPLLSGSQINEITESDISYSSEPLSDGDIVFATQSGGNRSIGSSSTDPTLSLYPRNSLVAVRIQNTSDIEGRFYLKYLWIEDEE